MLRAGRLQAGHGSHQPAVFIHTELRDVRPEDTDGHKHTSCTLCSVSRITGRRRDLREPQVNMSVNT